jgi:hypothetical protein
MGGRLVFMGVLYGGKGGFARMQRSGSSALEKAVE